ncbi:unnamed protein product [Parajaminaea phylloscopi]
MAASRTRTRPHRTHGTPTTTDGQLLAALSDVVTLTPPSHSTEFRSADQHTAPESSAAFAGAQPTRLWENPSGLPTSTMVPGEDPLASHVANAPPPPPPAKSSGMASKFVGAFRRQTDEEREARRKKADRAKKDLGRSKTMSGRMDIIDQMDLSGIHGSSMFHHDSPYDACSPHANRSSRKAPVKAFDPNTDPMTGLSLGPNPASASSASSPSNGGGDVPVRRGKGSSPLVPAGLQQRSEDAAWSDKAGVGVGVGRPGQIRGTSSRSMTSPLVPSLPLSGYDASSSAVNLPASDAASLSTESSNIDRDTDAERSWRHQQGYWTQPSNIPSNRADVSNPVADVWGVSSEPWQDFAQPKVKSRRPSGANGSRSMLSPYGSGDGSASAASSVLDMEAVMTGKAPADRRRGAARDGGADEIAGVSPFPEPDYSKVGGGFDNAQPKRSKSLIKRIKSARQYGNVPPPDDDVLELQGRRSAAQRAAHRHSPSSPPELARTGNGNGSAGAGGGGGGDWSNLTATQLGTASGGGGSSSLGRNGTRKATKEEQQAYYAEAYGQPSPSAGYSSPQSAQNGAGTGEIRQAGASPYLAPEDAGGYGSSDGRSGRTTDAKGAAGVGRSGSIFGRFGRKKSSDNRGALTSRS